jgi:uncharacterized protein YdcH (DUF465 family)
VHQQPNAKLIRQFHRCEHGPRHVTRIFMFPEYRDLISQLKTNDLHFSRLFEQHNALDQKVKNMETHIEPGTPADIENLKKEKLHLKDQIYTILKKSSTAA